MRDTSSPAAGGGETERDFAEETFFSVSFGDADRVHGHPDGGSVTYSAGGVNWVVDPGKFQTGRGPIRDHFLSRRAHSLVSVEGRAPKPDARVVLERQQVSSRSIDLMFRDDSYPGIDLSRRVIYSVHGEYLLIIDAVTAPTEVTAIQRWQLGPDVDTSISHHLVEMRSGSSIAALCFSGTRTDISTVRGQKEPVDGWVATGWKTKAPATAILARKTAAKLRFITVLALGKQKTPQIRTHRGTEPGGFCLTVDTGRVVENVLVERRGVSFPDEPPASQEDQQRPSTRRIRPTVSGRPPHIDATSRAEVRALVAQARARGFDAGAAERRDIADSLADQMHSRGLDADIDLGLKAAIADLHQAPRIASEGQRAGIINWDGSSDWTPTSYPCPVESHRGRLILNSAPRTPQIHTVVDGSFVIPYALAPGRDDTLTVILHGALDRARVRLPMFQRLRHQIEMDAGHTLAIADPNLDLASNLGLGWYLGSETEDIIPGIAASIESVARALGAGRIVLAGSSGGGYGALQIGAFIPEATVVAFSPQVDLRNYSPRLARLAAELSYGRREVPTEGHLLKRISVIERMRRQRTYPRTVLVTNTGDHHHRDMHEKLLLDAYRDAGHDAAISLETIDLGPGHHAPDNETYQRIMASVYERIM